MRIVLYEFVIGGGWYCDASGSPPASLVAEGSAMLRSLAADFHAMGGVAIDVLRDARYREVALPQCTIHEVHGAEEERQTLRRLAAAADWTVVIAPEFCGYLSARCRTVEAAGGRLLGPDSQLVALTSDKHATAEHLARHGVRTPNGVALAAGAPLPAEFAYPAVLKPRDGAGSQGLDWIAGPADRANGASPARLETYCPGTAASVAFLCGPRQRVPLVPCLQRLSADRQFTYLGGSLPIERHLARRATRLASRAVGSLPKPLGYLGVDLVLGDDPTGDADVVVEVNPRQTTSYVGLRALTQGNLAGSMLAVATGHEVELCWKLGPIQFEASGSVR